MSTRTYDGPPLHDPATYAHGFPYDDFRELRDEDPVSHHDHPGWERGYWVVTRHADVQRVSRDWTGFRNAPNPFLPDTATSTTSRHVAAADQPRPARPHEAAQDHQQRLHASSHQRPRRAREGTGRLGDRFGRRARRVRPRQRHRAVVAAARDRRPGRRARGGSQAGVRVDRAHVRFRSDAHRPRSACTRRRRCSRTPTRCAPSVGRTHATTS